jgi:hypothetical protein
MRSSGVVRASDCQYRSRNGPEFDPIILRHSGIQRAADEAVLNTVQIENKGRNLKSDNLKITPRNLNDIVLSPDNCF